ncbi:hypothetical protein EVAR_72554_1 [Eumeta japonica]|uniref:Uncharacterized protein n=1 Tax=Eumeta variegata TaxID=151549 RepID=A0A4C1T2S7_EUMVA|nr:hypothetical protein EVAR_72554_1 [Eumeta japonica]
MPMGQHPRRFKTPTIDEVAIVIVGEQFELRRRNEQLQRVSRLHRSYDALQYPTLFLRVRPSCHQQIARANVSSVWRQFGRTVLLPRPIVCRMFESGNTKVLVYLRAK